MLAQGRLVSRTLISVKWLFVHLCHCVREHLESGRFIKFIGKFQYFDVFLLRK